mgnify:CR=1 FL=1
MLIPRMFRSIPLFLSKGFAFLFLFILLSTSSSAQNELADSLNEKPKHRTRNIAIAATALYGASLYALNEAWYQESPRTDFHFFNDNAQWKQVDKVGHFYSAFHISQASIHLFQHAGMTKKKAHLWGGMMGFLIMAPIEVLDGFSEEYGASWGDLAANAIGSGAAMAQYMIWDQARIKPKFSFTPTDLAAERPNVLGDGLHEEILKDYNGQTYWLSVDIYAFLRQESKFPKWLNLAIGYGAENMIYANDHQNHLAGYDAYRQYYLAIDFDLSYLKGKNKVVNTLLYVVDLIHLPAPALEYNRSEGLKFHFLKF